MNISSYNSILLNSPGSFEGRDILREILNNHIYISPRKVDKPVVLYGAGSLGKMAKLFFDSLNIPFLYIVDKNANRIKLNNDWIGVEVISPEEIDDNVKKNCLLVVCIVTTPLIKLCDELKSDGWKDLAFFYDVCEAYSNQYPLTNGWFLNDLNKDEKYAIERVFLKLDRISQMHYLQFIAWRKLRVELIFKGININLENRFFIEEIVSVLNNNEDFIDCGAHFGNVSKEFIKIVDNEYNSIYSIEADECNYLILKKNMATVKNSILGKFALGDRIHVGRFSEGYDYASKIVDSGNRTMEIVTLDSLEIPATFIKMHLEGGELNALKGAKKTIQNYRPIIAITIYHNSDGVWEIPNYLINNFQNYKYYLRLHSWGGTGAVFYGIPEERNKHL